MAVGRRSVLRALFGATVSNALPPGGMPAMAKAAAGNAESTAMPLLSDNFIEAVAERFVDGVLDDKNVRNLAHIIIDLGENQTAPILDKKWEMHPPSAFLDITDENGYLDFKALLDAPAVVAKLPDVLIRDSEFCTGARSRLVTFIDEHFTLTLNQLHYLLKLDEKTFLSLQQSKGFKDYISEFNGSDTNIALTHDDIKRRIATKLEEMQVALREADRVLPEEGETKGLTAFEALLRQKLEYYGNEEFASKIIAQMDGMDEKAKLALKMELEYAEYFHHRLGAYSGLPEAFDQMLDHTFKIHQAVSASRACPRKIKDEYEESLGEKHLRDCAGAMDETLRNVVSRLSTPKSFSTQMVGENAVRLSSQLLNRAIMPKAIEILEQMFGDAALITQEQSAVRIAFDPQNAQHQIARDLLESPLPNPLNEILAASPQQAAWADRVNKDIAPPATSVTV